MDKSSEGVTIDSAVSGVNCEPNHCTTGESIADEWLIVSKRDSKSRLLPRRMIFVGRQDCDICVQSTTVDMRHAVLFFNGQYFHIKDLNSTYGTYVNDKRIAGQCYIKLEHSDRIRFGFGPDLFIIEKISSLPEKIVTSDPKLIADETEFFNSSVSQSQDKEDIISKNIIDLNNKKPMPRLVNENNNSRSNSSLSNDSLDEIKSSKQVINSKLSDKKQLTEMNEEMNNFDTITAPNTCASPTNTGPDSLGSVSSATAFTISFDDEDNKKKLNIRDSIRQFAPPKPDSIEKPRLPKSAKSESKSNENSFSNRKSPTNQSKRQNNASNSAKTNPTNRFKDSLNSSPTKSSPEPSGNLSDSATYLINRMLSNRVMSKLTQTPDNSRPGSAKDNRNEKADSGLCDDIKSDSGNTYTIEDNDELENARKKIDEVFGVNDDSATLSLNSSPDSSLTLNSPILLKNLEQAAKDRLLYSPKFDRKSVASDSDSKQLTFTRTKRRAPTAQEMLHMFEPKIEENQKVNNNSSNLYSNDLNRSFKSSLLNNITNKCDNQSKAVVTQSAPSTPRSPLIARKLMELRINSKQNPNLSNLNRRKNSWTSDLDYNESYNSDESTDQSHRSSNSAISKDGGSGHGSAIPSKINFNRAFALRRARLGIETPGIDVSKKPNPKTPNLNRNDGGRFSLRVPKRDSLSDSGKKVINRISNVSKTNLQRKGSDPHSGPKTGLSRAQPFSDTERRNSLNSDRGIQMSNRQNSNLNNRSNSYNSRQKTVSDIQVSTPQRYNRIDNRNGNRNQSQNSHFENNMSLSSTEPSHKPPINLHQSKNPSKSSLELTALDGLVISAINHLSHKLRNNMIDVLENQRLENPVGSPSRNLIDEVLPQISALDRRQNETNLSVSRDLSSILKNLKKVEQSLEVVNTLFEPNGSNSSKPYRKPPNNFFVVDV